MCAATAAGWLALTAASASAHDAGAGFAGAPPWTFDRWIVVPLLVSAVLFATGWLRLRGRSRIAAVRWRGRGLTFAAGWCVVALALVSPLHAAGERSFAAHMLEHELLMLLGAPLLVIAEPWVVMLWALPRLARMQLGKVVNRRSSFARGWTWATLPSVATALQAAVLWLWHAPALFDLALAHPGWHAAQHIAFLGSALLFWRAMLGHGQRTQRGVSALCLFVTSLVSGALGALMAFSQSPWYAGYAQLGIAPFGLTRIEDQQIAGLLMWIPGGLLHAAVALLFLRGLLVAADPPSRRAHAA